MGSIVIMVIDPAFFTALGAAFAIFLTALGSAIGIAHGGVFALRSEDKKGLVPVVQAGVLSVYGLIIGVWLCKKFDGTEISLNDGYKHLSAGLSVGLACLASGYGMAVFIQQCNEKHCMKKLILVMIFLESIGLYGFIMAVMLLLQKSSETQVTSVS